VRVCNLRKLAGLVLVAILTACAPKRLPAPTPGVQRFPDFVYPTAPEGLGEPGILEQHQTGWLYLQAGDTRNADRAFSAIVKSSPEFYPAEAGLGYAALARKDAQAAVNYFDRALAKNTSYAPALAGKGDALLSAGRTEAALEAFESALKADPSMTALRSRVDVLRFRDAQQQIASARKSADAGQFDESRRAYLAAIAASPQSAFLYRELAGVDRRAGDLASALIHAQQAVTLDPSDARALTLVAEIYEANHDWTKAAAAYAAAGAIEPGDALAAKADAMRERAAFDTMPEEYRTIESAETITRAQLAALLAVRFEDLLRRARSAGAVVLTDTRGNWAAPWILAITRAGVMDAFPNHTFQPSTVVRRVDLAQAANHVLTLIAAERPRVAARWSDAHPQFPDVSPSHLSYPAAARAVASGVMTTDEGGAFQLTRPVTGAEALTTVSHLEALAGGTSR
jgi:tetratricopeptide (TPR) repeat protein